MIARLLRRRRVWLKSKNRHSVVRVWAEPTPFGWQAVVPGEYGRAATRVLLKDNFTVDHHEWVEWLFEGGRPVRPPALNLTIIGKTGKADEQAV